MIIHLSLHLFTLYLILPYVYITSQEIIHNTTTITCVAFENSCPIHYFCDESLNPSICVPEIPLFSSCNIASATWDANQHVQCTIQGWCSNGNGTLGESIASIGTCLPKRQLNDLCNANNAATCINGLRCISLNINHFYTVCRMMEINNETTIETTITPTTITTITPTTTPPTTTPTQSMLNQPCDIYRSSSCISPDLWCADNGTCIPTLPLSSSCDLSHDYHGGQLNHCGDMTLYQCTPITINPNNGNDVQSTCQYGRRRGETCGMMQKCSYPLLCREGQDGKTVCVDQDGDGTPRTPCNPYLSYSPSAIASCGINTWCYQGLCIDQLPLDSRCNRVAEEASQRRQCTSNGWCQLDSPTRSPGDPYPNPFVTLGTCVRNGIEGQDCDPKWPASCRQPYTCIRVLMGTQHKCGMPLQNGATCTSHTECAGGWCRPATERSPRTCHSNTTSTIGDAVTVSSVSLLSMLLHLLFTFSLALVI